MKKQERLANLEKSYNKFIDDLPSFKTEQEALDALNQISNSYHVKSFQSPSVQSLNLMNFLNIEHFEDDSFRISYPTLFGFAVAKKWQKLAIRFIELGVNISNWNSIKPAKEPFAREDELSPLMLACAYELEEVVKTILARNLGSTSQVSRVAKKTAKEFSESTAIKALFEAKEKEQEPIRNITLFQKYCDQGEIKNAEELFLKIALKKDINLMKQCLYSARNAWLSLPDMNKEFDALCQKIKNEIAELKADPNPVTLKEPVDLAEAYNILYKEPYLEDEISSREDAIKNIIAKIFVLFQNREQCLQYLCSLNADFLDYFKTTHNKEFPTLDSSSYEFQDFDGYKVPIPKFNSDIQKHHSLQEFLALFFEPYGIGHNAFKLIGFVPKILVNSMVQNGNFLTESQLGGGWFHNKLAHMVQWALIIYAIKNNDIDLKYIIDGDTIQITEREIFSRLVMVKIPGTLDTPIWDQVIDRTKDYLTFSDPTAMSFYIMQFGAEKGFRAIADYLIDTHFKGLRAFFHAYKQLPEYSALESFIEKIKECNFSEFIMPPHLYEHALKCEEQKGRAIENRSGNSDQLIYAVIRKQYKPNTKFKFHNQNENCNSTEQELNTDFTTLKI